MHLETTQIPKVNDRCILKDVHRSTCDDIASGRNKSDTKYHAKSNECMFNYMLQNETVKNRGPFKHHIT